MSIEIAFYKGRKRFGDRVIQWWTRSPYSHCEVVTHRRSDGAAWCISSSWVDGGVRGKWIALDPTRWDLVQMPGVDSAGAHLWLAQHAGQGYDFIGLLGFVWRPIAGSARRWFCSEACADIVELEEPWRLSPGALRHVARVLAATRWEA